MFSPIIIFVAESHGLSPRPWLGAYWAHFSCTGRGQGCRPHGLGAGAQGASQRPRTPHIVLAGWKSALLMLDHAARQPNVSGSCQSPSIEGMLSYQQTFFLPISSIWMGTVTMRRAHRWRSGILMNTFSKTIARRDIIVINILPLTQTKSHSVWQRSL